MSKVRELEMSRRPLMRSGEGTAIDIQQQNVVRTDGGSITMIGVDLSAAPVPERRYVADFCSVLPGPGLVRILFGQERVSGAPIKLRSLLVVHMTMLGIEQFVDSVAELKNPGLAQILATVGLQPEAPAQVPEEPEQTVALTSNIVIAAIAGHESCLDFYHSSAFAMNALSKSQKLVLDPVVRVMLRSSLMAGLVDRLRALTAATSDSRAGGG